MLLSLIKCIHYPDWTNAAQLSISLYSITSLCQPEKATETCVPEVTKTLCVPTLFSHSSEGFRRVLLCYFSQVLSQMVFDRLLQALSNNCQSWLAPVRVCDCGGGEQGHKALLLKAHIYSPLCLTEKRNLSGDKQLPPLKWKL